MKSFDLKGYNQLCEIGPYTIFEHPTTFRHVMVYTRYGDKGETAEMVAHWNMPGLASDEAVLVPPGFIQAVIRAQQGVVPAPRAPRAPQPYRPAAHWAPVPDWFARPGVVVEEVRAVPGDFPNQAAPPQAPANPAPAPARGAGDFRYVNLDEVLGDLEPPMR